MGLDAGQGRAGRPGANHHAERNIVCGRNRGGSRSRFLATGWHGARRGTKKQWKRSVQVQLTVLRRWKRMCIMLWVEAWCGTKYCTLAKIRGSNVSVASPENFTSCLC